MIDINKYKGHSEGHKNGSWDLYEMYGSNDKLQLEIRPLHDKWGITIPITSVGVKDAKLIADAPMLLEEVKRLREQLMKAKKWVHYHCQAYTSAVSMMKNYEDYMTKDIPYWNHEHIEKYDEVIE
tara:strand:+ start:416 stop:790 length:375 start_codon:yes stop_codon:yes gene_type:complete